MYNISIYYIKDFNSYVAAPKIYPRLFFMNKNNLSSVLQYHSLLVPLKHNLILFSSNASLLNKVHPSISMIIKVNSVLYIKLIN